LTPFCSTQEAIQNAAQKKFKVIYFTKKCVLNDQFSHVKKMIFFVLTPKPDGVVRAAVVDGGAAGRDGCAGETLELVPARV